MSTAFRPSPTLFDSIKPIAPPSAHVSRFSTTTTTTPTALKVSTTTATTTTTTVLTGGANNTLAGSNTDSSSDNQHARNTTNTYCDETASTGEDVASDFSSIVSNDNDSDAEEDEEESVVATTPTTPTRLCEEKTRQMETSDPASRARTFDRSCGTTGDARRDAVEDALTVSYRLEIEALKKSLAELRVLSAPIPIVQSLINDEGTARTAIISASDARFELILELFVSERPPYRPTLSAKQTEALLEEFNTQYVVLCKARQAAMDVFEDGSAEYIEDLIAEDEFRRRNPGGYQQDGIRIRNDGCFDMRHTIGLRARASRLRNQLLRVGVEANAASDHVLRTHGAR